MFQISRSGLKVGPQLAYDRIRKFKVSKCAGAMSPEVRYFDLQYAMELVFPQTATLYQVGDTVSSGSFNSFLDALDTSCCTFMGGDSKDPNVDGHYPDTKPGGFNGP